VEKPIDLTRIPLVTLIAESDNLLPDQSLLLHQTHAPESYKQVTGPMKYLTPWKVM